MNMKATTRNRSAELHSAVSQICNLRGVGSIETLGNLPRPDECNAAIQSIGNPRYLCSGPRQALLHRQSSGAAQRPAFTGLFRT